MKHTFECGIVGTSNDSAGDQFLSGMMRDEANDRSAEFVRKLVEFESIRRDYEALKRALCSIVFDQGGELFISDHSSALIGSTHNLISFRDDNRGGTILRVRSKGNHI